MVHEEKQRQETERTFGPPLFHRVMRKVHPQGFENFDKGSIFKIMSYNLLSEENLKKNATHLLADDPCRDSMYRYNRILAEIEQSNADLICM